MSRSEFRLNWVRSTIPQIILASFALSIPNTLPACIWAWRTSLCFMFLMPDPWTCHQSLDCLHCQTLSFTSIAFLTICATKRSTQRIWLCLWSDNSCHGIESVLLRLGWVGWISFLARRFLIILLILLFWLIWVTWNRGWFHLAVTWLRIHILRAWCVQGW